MELKKQSINSFTKGMDKDIDISLLSKESYLHAENFRLTSSTGNTSMSLEVVDGNFPTHGLNFDPTHVIIGSCSIRNTLVLFTTNNTNSRIYKLNVNDGSLDTNSLIYDDSTTIDGSKLNFNTANPIKAIGRYETDLVQKVYFTDGVNNLRFFNIIGLASNQVVGKFDIIPSYATGNINYRPKFESFTSGILKAGRIQYAYQLFDKNGSETLFSPTSSLISLTDSNLTATNNKDFKGDNKDTNTGKGVRISIPSPTGFTKIRVISIFYDQLNGLPSINIIAEQDIVSSTGSLYFYDHGVTSLGTYTYEEIAVVGRFLFSPKELETKNNYLFAANILQREWDIDYDARSYRYVPSTATGTLTVGQSALFTSTGSYGILNSSFQILGSNVPSTHDAINPFNDISLDDSRDSTSPITPNLYHFQYMRNGTTLGGEGPNVTYSFTTSPFTLDSNVIGNEITTVFTDYSNTTLEINNLGYQRDEIYRFGIVFYDDKGRSSTVKWIGDVRFPTMSYSSIADEIIGSTGDVVGITGRTMGIVFSISNIPSEVKAYQIVRCRRESQDRTVVAQGIATPLQQRGSLLFHTIFPESTFINSGSVSNDLYEFISPEVNINNNLTYNSGDRLDYIGRETKISSYCNITNTYESGHHINAFDDHNSYVYKYHALSPATNQRRNIIRSSIQPPSFVSVPVDIGEVYKYENISNYGDTIPNIIISPGGTKLIAKISSPFNITPTSSIARFNGVTLTLENVPYMNYRRSISQYGGNSYNDRQNNVYIECGDIIPRTTPSTITFGGDIYIAMYDYLRNIGDINNTTNEHRNQLILYFPVETSINLRYRIDKSFSRLTDDPYHTRLFLTEKAGVYGTAPNQFIQLDDLYQYNSVYSQEDTTIKYFPKNDNVLYGDRTYDSRIIVSNKKINGETNDSWLIFETNNFLDADSGYGPINSLLQYNDQLLFWQDKAFGNISVNPRSLISDNNPGQLVLGTGAVLDRYDYISTTVGNKSQFGVIPGLSGIYWYDTLGKTFYSYGGSVKPLSKMKGLFSYLNTFGDANTSCIGTYDYKYNEVIATLTNGASQSTTLSYNELVDSFVSFYTFNPQIYIPVYNEQYYTTPVGSITMYIHNSSSGNKAAFYGQGYQSKLSFVVNDNFQYTKVFDSLQYVTKSKNSIGSDLYGDTFGAYRVSNTKQNTDYVSIIIGGNTRKRENGLITTIDRNSVTQSSINNVNIFDSSFLSSNRLFRERIRDKYIIVDMIYSNSDNSSFSVPYIITNYRVSIR